MLRAPCRRGTSGRPSTMGTPACRLHAAVSGFSAARRLLRRSGAASVLPALRRRRPRRLRRPAPSRRPPARPSPPPSSPPLPARTRRPTANEPPTSRLHPAFSSCGHLRAAYHPPNVVLELYRSRSGFSCSASSSVFSAVRGIPAHRPHRSHRPLALSAAHHHGVRLLDDGRAGQRLRSPRHHAQHHHHAVAPLYHHRRRLFRRRPLLRGRLGAHLRLHLRRLGRHRRAQDRHLVRRRRVLRRHRRSLQRPLRLPRPHVLLPQRSAAAGAGHAHAHRLDADLVHARQGRIGRHRSQRRLDAAPRARRLPRLRHDDGADRRALHRARRPTIRASTSSSRCWRSWRSPPTSPPSGARASCSPACTSESAQS